MVSSRRLIRFQLSHSSRITYNQQYKDLTASRVTHAAVEGDIGLRRAGSSYGSCGAKLLRLALAGHIHLQGIDARRRAARIAVGRTRYHAVRFDRLEIGTGSAHLPRGLRDPVVD